MTRRILSLVLVAALMVVALTGCAKKAVYVDGSYVGHSAADKSGNVGQIMLTIAGDKITEAKYTELMPKTKDNYPYPTAVDTIATMQAKLMETGDIAMVDAVAKATGTSGQLKDAVNDALKNAGSVGAYTDGTYVGYSTADNLGNIGYAAITVSAGKITDAKLADLQVKTIDNYQYATSINAWSTLEQSLITTQDPAKVDAVSQATGTSTLFKEAATVALELARSK
jgi:major membrane immunogen (membrane-anchored lipoprotein)